MIITSGYPPNSIPKPIFIAVLGLLSCVDMRLNIHESLLDFRNGS